MRHLDKLVVGVADLRRRLDVGRRDGLRQSDLGGIARDCAALWETTLKVAETNWQSKRESLFSMTNLLGKAGWKGSSALHSIRELSNEAKHNSSAPAATADQVDAWLTTLEVQAPYLAPILPNLLDDDAPQVIRRRVVCAIYDNFVHGDTEFLFLLALPGDGLSSAVELDGFQVENAHDATIRAQLESLEGWEYQPEEFELLRDELARDSSDLWRIASATASYPEILAIVEPYQHSLPLISGLHRADYAGDVLASLARLQLEYWNDHGMLLSVADLVVRSGSGILRRVDVPKLAERVTDLLLNVALPQKLELDRATPAQFQAQVARKPLAVDEKSGLVLSPEGVVYVLLR